MDQLYIIVPIVVGIGGFVWYFLNNKGTSTQNTKNTKPVIQTAPLGTDPAQIRRNSIEKVRKKKLAQKKDEKIEGHPCKIFFGSQTGTAEDFSHKIAAEGKRYGFATEVIDCEDYDFDELHNEIFVIFVMATYGEGEPTDNARPFDEWMNNSARTPEDLKNVKFTVFGLGNKTYEQFNAMGRKVDQKIEEFGGTRVYPKGEGDDDGSLEDDFAAWKRELWPTLCEHFGMPVPEIEENLNERRFRVDTFGADSSEAKVTYDQSHIHLAKRNAKESASFDIKNPYLAKLVVNYELHTSESDRSCRHIEFEIGDKLKYEVGDHLGVYAENDPELVAQVAARLDVNLDNVIAMFPINKTDKAVVGPCTVRQALSQWCDISGQPRKNVLRVLAKYAKEPQEKQRLLALCDENNNAEYQSYIKDDQRTILCVLNDFPSVRIPFDHFLEIVPRLAARMYSISSSLREHPGRVHITAIVVDFTTRTGRKHKGVATHWLRRQIPSSENKPILVPVFIEKANFRLPKDPATPIVMIGPGTGLAPFRGFVQERKHMVKEAGVQSEALLFFGCRSKKFDFIYEEELSMAKDHGHISELVVAFSREGPQKVYVQHRMHDFAQGLYDVIHEKKGYFYVCGDARTMAKDVRQTLKDIIMKHSNKTDEEAELFLTEMQKGGRYLQDVWF